MNAHRAPGEGRYAHLEREQRWLLTALPAGTTDPVDIYDRYIIGTRFRLRRVGEDVFKLGQKVPSGPDSVQLTNTYLSAEEYAVFAALPARELRKQRRHLTIGGRDYAVDEFTDRDLLLAEVELSADEPHLPLPPFAIRDVTGDPAFSGGNLAI